MLRKSIVVVALATLSLAPAAFAADDAPAAAPASIPAAAPAPAATPAAGVKPKKKLEKTCNDIRVPKGAKPAKDAKPDDGVKPANGIKPKVLC